MQENPVIPFFITGTGTDVGKSLVTAILAKALDAWYWKPVQAGSEPANDSQTIQRLAGIPSEKIWQESYRLQLPASPHWAAEEEGLEIDLQKIEKDYLNICFKMQEREPGKKQVLLIEGAGGLMVPLNKKEFVADLIKQLKVPAILVSRHYLGSINHSLLTALACQLQGIPVSGWIFNGSYGHYGDDILKWSGIPLLATLPELETVSEEVVAQYAEAWKEQLKPLLT